MGFPVFCQVRRSRGGVISHITLKRPIICMSTFVLIQSKLTCGSVIAYVTFEGSFIGMSAYMRKQNVFCSELGSLAPQSEHKKGRSLVCVRT